LGESLRVTDPGVFLEGTTDDGVHVIVTGHPPYGDFEVRIDGEVAKVIADTATIYQDGGTVRIPTNLGEVLAWRRLGTTPYNALDRKKLRPPS
jgi:hypothetical protein